MTTTGVSWRWHKQFLTDEPLPRPSHGLSQMAIDRTQARISELEANGKWLEACREKDVLATLRRTAYTVRAWK